MRNRLTLLLLVLSGLVIFLAGIENPPHLIYDEPLYVNAGRALLAGTHDPSPYGPPLGKLLVAASIKLFGDGPLGWRFANALFGSLALAAVFLLADLLLNDYTLALTAAALTFLNNFLYVMSRTAMVDVFLVTFGLWGVVAFVAALKTVETSPRKARALLACSGILLGLACAFKWNGVDQLCALIAIGAGLLLFGKKSSNPEIVSYATNLSKVGTPYLLISAVVLPLVAYFSTFWPLCRMLHLTFSLDGVAAMNLYIWHFHRQVLGNPAITDPWYKWPLQVQPARALSYLVGNWYVMWAGLAACLFSVRRMGRAFPETLILLLYAVNLFQWAVTPQSCAYYYYYFPAAMYLGLAIALALHRLPQRMLGVRVSLVSVVPAVCVFAYCLGHMAHLPPPFDSALGYWP